MGDDDMLRRRPGLQLVRPISVTASPLGEGRNHETTSAHIISRQRTASVHVRWVRIRFRACYHTSQGSRAILRREVSEVPDPPKSCDGDETRACPRARAVRTSSRTRCDELTPSGARAPEMPGRRAAACRPPTRGDRTNRSHSEAAVARAPRRCPGPRARRRCALASR